MSRNSVVLGSASNLPASQFEPFLRSLRETSFEGLVVIFVSRMRDEDVASLADLADQVICVDDRYPPIVPNIVVGALDRVRLTRGARRFYPAAYRMVGTALRADPGSARAIDLEYRLQGIQALRYGHYLEFLRAHPSIDQVMISDLRDVVFQEDPFAADVDGLEVFLEEPHVRTTSEGFNRRWLVDLYGDEGLESLGDEVISCSGVTFGTHAAMIGYLMAMVREVAKHTIPLGPHDQGVHNWLLYTGQLPGASSIRNGAGRVQTMGAQAEVLVDSGGRVLNPDGTRPAVLHQYDRHGSLAAVLLERFSSA